VFGAKRIAIFIVPIAELSGRFGSVLRPGSYRELHEPDRYHVGGIIAADR
jgi:hypothetical protein